MKNAGPKLKAFVLKYHGHRSVFGEEMSFDPNFISTSVLSINSMIEFVTNCYPSSWPLVNWPLSIPDLPIDYFYL